VSGGPFPSGGLLTTFYDENRNVLRVFLKQVSEADDRLRHLAPTYFVDE
jgi:hypothetical protein